MTIYHYDELLLKRKKSTFLMCALNVHKIVRSKDA